MFCSHPFIERNAIALLNNYNRAPQVDAASASWLGHSSSRERVDGSGLWNNDYVDEECDQNFIKCAGAYPGSDLKDSASFPVHCGKAGD